MGEDSLTVEIRTHFIARATITTTHASKLCCWRGVFGSFLLPKRADLGKELLNLDSGLGASPSQASFSVLSLQSQPESLVPGPLRGHQHIQAYWRLSLSTWESWRYYACQIFIRMTRCHDASNSEEELQASHTCSCLTSQTCSTLLVLKQEDL